LSEICRHFRNEFERAVLNVNGNERRIGAELKFPIVFADGSSVDFETVYAFWKYLHSRGWEVIEDDLTNNIVGASKSGEMNDTIAGCETGFSKSEFSLAHVGNLFDLEKSINELQEELRPFAEQNDVNFLGYGIHPLTPPSDKLLMKKGRTSVWDKVFGSNRCLPPEDGDDVCMFTINAASHVHVSVSIDEAVDAVNVLNGFAPAQIALTANSNIWRGEIDPEYKCVSETFWDRWMPDADRIGVPPVSFIDLEHYVNTISNFKPVYVKRHGKPIVLKNCETFSDYFESNEAAGIDTEGNEVKVSPEVSDIDLHGSCYWYNARISRYYTVENRANDQQPPDDLMCIPAITLGLITALPEAIEEISRYNWSDLRSAREAACRYGLADIRENLSLTPLVESMLQICKLGLERRGLGEEKFLEPLYRRVEKRKCPADDAAEIFRNGGIKALITKRSFT